MKQKPNHPAATPVAEPLTPAAPRARRPMTSAACRLMAAIAATATLAACQTQLNDPLDNIQPASHTRTLNVQMPTNQQPNTRVAYDDLDLDLTWQEGDELEVSYTIATSTFTLVSGAGTKEATFSGVDPGSPDNATYDVRHRAANYAPPVPDEVMAFFHTTPQQQTGNNNTDHLRRHLALSVGNVTLDKPIPLQLYTSILKLSLHNLPAPLGKLSSLRWTAETAERNDQSGSIDLSTPGPIYNYTLNLTDATPDADHNFTAYIAFDASYMSVCQGGSFSVTLTAEDGTTYMASTTSADGKAYEQGKRYTASMGNTAAGEAEWKRVVTASGTEALDPKVFNAKSPVWVITGGGTTEDDAKVCANVKAALLALPEGTENIELTMTGVKTVGEKAFYDCQALKTLSLPQATSIGEYAFYACIALKTISAPQATGTIGESAFQDCEALTTVSLPQAKSIRKYAFRNCFALTTVSLPQAESIGNRAFQDCEKLATITLPAATSIGELAFADCTALKTLSLPAATDIGVGAFSRCSALTRLELTAAGSITLHALTFDGFANAAACTLVLNPNKKADDTGAATPKVIPDRKWGGYPGSELQWQAIEHPSAP